MRSRGAKPGRPGDAALSRSALSPAASRLAPALWRPRAKNRIRSAASAADRESAWSNSPCAARSENVGATTAQEDKIHDIVAATFTELDKDGDGRDALRKQVLDLMRAPTLDRAAIEKLRAENVAAFDAKSKAIVAAVVDAAGQLTPAQRVKLAQNAEDRMAHPWWGGQRRFGPGGGRDTPERGGPDHG